MNTMKTRIKGTAVLILLMIIGLTASAQGKASIGLVNIDLKGITIDNATFTSMVHLELEKTNMYEVMDKYDVAYALEKEKIEVNNCFGKTQLIDVGKKLNVDKMFTGSVEKFGDKIIMIYKVIDIKTGTVEKTNVNEYLDLMEEIQVMVRMSIQDLFEMEKDQVVLELLKYYDRPINTGKKAVSLNGPRTGLSFTGGNLSNRLMAPVSQGGLDMYPVSMMLGYQFEKQYISSGDFQALIEFIPAINGLESGVIIPSLSVLNGFRFNESGWEIGLGPVIRAGKFAKGYYDPQGNWVRTSVAPEGQTLTETLDHRGDVMLKSGLILAVGKTFRSGYLNIPVNLYVSPNKEGTTVGLSFGFNVLNKSTGL